MAILKGDFREVVHFGVSHLLNQERSVAQFESWQDARRGTSGAISGHRTYQGVPITQEELDKYYHALKKYTGLTKSKIGSGKVLYRDLELPIAIEYRGKVFLVAPFIPSPIKVTWIPKPPSAAPPLTSKELLTRARELGKEGYGVGRHSYTQDLTLSVLCHNPEQEPSLVVKMIEAWEEGWNAERRKQKPPRTPPPSVPAILAPAPAAPVLPDVPMGLGGGGIPPIPGVEPPAPTPAPTRRQPAKAATKKPKSPAKNKEHDFKVKDTVKLLGEWGHIIEVRADDVRIKLDGLSSNTNLICKDMLHKVPYRPDPIAKMRFYWQVKPRTPAPSDMASVPVRLGGGGVPPIPGLGAAAPAKKRRQPAAKPATKPRAKTAAAPKAKKTAAKKPKNGKAKKTAPKLTANQQKHLNETGSVMVRRGGKFITITKKV